MSSLILDIGHRDVMIQPLARRIEWMMPVVVSFPTSPPLSLSFSRRRLYRCLVKSKRNLQSKKATHFYGNRFKKLMFDDGNSFVCLIRNENGSWSQSFKPFISHLHIELNQQETSFLGWRKYTLLWLYFHLLLLHLPFLFHCLCPIAIFRFHPFPLIFQMFYNL